MTSSTWRALGNTYVVVEPGGMPLDASSASVLAQGTDGVLEVLAVSKNRVEIAIWNPDGSTAELSGNGTRIAAAWLAARSGAQLIDVVVGDRTVVARMLGDGTVEQEMGEVVVGQAETVDGLSVRPVSVGNPHAVVLGDPDTITEIGPFLEAHARFPEVSGAMQVNVRYATNRCGYR